MYCAIDKFHDAPALSEKRLVLALKSIKESGHLIILLTARKDRFAEETKRQLSQLGLSFDVILHAPNESTEDGADQKHSTKGEVLKAHLASLSAESLSGIKRLIVIDDKAENLAAIESSLSDDLCFKGELSLNHYVPNTQLLTHLEDNLGPKAKALSETAMQDSLQEKARESKHFPKQLTDIKVIQGLGGGTASTYEVNVGGRRYVLKHGASEDALKMEVLTNALYAAVGVPVPAIQCYGVIPDALAKRLSLPKTKVAVQLAEKVEANDRQSEAVIRAQAAKDFVVHAFLGNIDVAKANNFIVDKTGQAILIDSGANFIFRALGDYRSEDGDDLDELSTLRDSLKNHTGEKWFKHLSSNDLKKQALALINQRDVIEKTVWTVINQLDVSEPLKERIIDGFSHRFEQLATHFELDEMMYPKSDKKAVEGKTSAGILTLAKNSQGELVVLLSKRVRHEWWDNFGGKSDKGDRNLALTASREVLEESSDELYYSPEMLAESAFHEIMTMKGGQKHLYRLYIMLNDKDIDLSRLTDHEHTAHKWVRVSDLLNALKSPKEITLEHKKTILVSVLDDDIDADEVPLFPPLYDLLKQPPLQAFLNAYVVKGTDPLKSAEYFRRRYVLSELPKSDPAESKLAVADSGKAGPGASSAGADPIKRGWVSALPSVRQVKNKVTQTLLSKEAVLEEIKSRRETKETIPPALSQCLSQTELHLKLILGDAFKESSSIEENVKCYFKTYPSLYRRVDMPAFVAACVELIEEERKHPDSIIFYHACSDKVAYAYEVYTLLYQMLKADRRYDSFRSEHPLFKTLQHVSTFIEYYTKKGGGTIDNYSDDYMALALSCNFFLFGNHETKTSHTLSYFLNNDSKTDIDLDTLLEVIFKPLGIPDRLIKELNAHFKHSPYKGKGMLYQLRMEKDEADKYAYASGFVGVLNPTPFTQTHTPSEMLKEMRGAVNDETKKNKWKNYIHGLQARVMAPPEAAIKTIKKRFDARTAVSAERDPAFEDRLQTLVKTIAHHYLYEDRMEHSTKDAALPLLKQKKEVLTSLGINEKEATGISLEDIKQLIADNQPDKIKTLVQQHPGLLTETLHETKRRGYTSSYSGDHQRDTQTTLLELLIKSNKMTDCLYALYGEHFYEGYDGPLPFICQHLRPSNHLHYIEKVKEDTGDYVACIYSIYKDLPSSERQAFLKCIVPCVTDLGILIYILESKHIYYHSSRNPLDSKDKGYLAGCCEDLIKNVKDLLKVIYCLYDDEAEVNLASKNSSKLQNMSDIKVILKILLRNPQLEKFIESIKDKITDTDSLKIILMETSSVSTMHQYVIDCFDHLINTKHDLLSVLPELDGGFRRALIEKHSDSLQSCKDVFDVVALLRGEEKLVILNQHADKIKQIRDVRKGIKLLSEENRFEFLKTHVGKIQTYDDLEILGKCFYEASDRQDFFEAHIALIYTFKQFKHLLSMLSGKERYQFAEKHQDKIQGPHHLSDVLMLLDEKDQTTFILKRSYLFNDMTLLLKTLKLLNSAQKKKLVKDNMALIIRRGKVHDMLSIYPEGSALPEVLEVLSKVNDAKGLLIYLRALPKEAQYPTLLKHVDKITTIHKLNLLLAFMPESDRLDFISPYAPLIEKNSDLIPLIKQLPENKRATFIETHIVERLDDQTVMLLASYLPTDAISEFLERYMSGQQTEDEIIQSLEYFTPLKRANVLSTCFHRLSTPESVCKALSLLSGHMYSTIVPQRTFVPKTVYRLTDETLFRQLLSLVPDTYYKKRLLMKNNHFFADMSFDTFLDHMMKVPAVARAELVDILLKHNNKPSVSQLAKLLRCLPAEEGLLCLQRQSHTVLNAKDLITVLCQLPVGMRRRFMPTRKVDIESPRELLFLARSLAPQAALTVCKDYAESINNETLFLDIVGNLPVSVRNEFVEAHPDKITSARCLKHTLELMTAPVSETFFKTQATYLAGGALFPEVLRLLPEDNRMAYLNSHIDSLYVQTDIVACAALLPEAERVDLIQRFNIDQIFIGMFIGDILKLIALLPEDVRLDYLKPIEPRLTSGYLLTTIALLPEKNRLDFFRQKKKELNNDYLISLIPLLPIEVRIDFINEHDIKIKRLSHLKTIVPALPQIHRLKFIQDHSEVIRSIYDLTNCMSLLSEECRYELVKGVDLVIDSHYDIARVSGLLPPEDRLSFIKAKVTEFTSAYQCEVFMPVLPSSEREGFLKDHSGVIKNFNDLKRVMPFFSDAFRVSYTLSFGAEIQSSNDLSNFLMCLPESERLQYALKYEDTIDGAGNLAEIIKTLPDEDKLVFTVRHESLIKTNDNLWRIILSYSSEDDKQRVAEMYHDKVRVDYDDFLSICQAMPSYKARSQFAQLFRLTKTDLNTLKDFSRYRREKECMEEDDDYNSHAFRAGMFYTPPLFLQGKYHAALTYPKGRVEGYHWAPPTEHKGLKVSWI